MTDSEYHNRQSLALIAYYSSGSISIAGDNHIYNARIVYRTRGFNFKIKPYQFRVEDITNIGVAPDCSGFQPDRIYIVLNETRIIEAIARHIYPEETLVFINL